ncbi:MAG: inner-membrane translocator [Clostridia bacterium]|nr:inner-membrane translocator [Clostridia bacterium]
MENVETAPEMPKKGMTAEKKHKIKQLLINLTPVIGLVLLLVLYLIVGGIRGINFASGFEAIINQSIVVAIVATGAIFIFTLGSFDISLGASTLVSACAGALVYMSTQNLFLMFLVCVLTAVACSLFSSVLGSVFNLPVFVTTVAMMSVLMAVAELLITSRGGNQLVASGAGAADSLWLKILLLAIFAAICIFVFSFMKTGRRQKFLGGNPVCAKLTGISLKKYAIIAFALTGLGVGIAAFLTVLRAPTVTSGTAGDVGMSIFIAIVFGGMPISGGPRSRIYAAIIGSFTITFLNQVLFFMLLGVAGADGISQIVRAIFFLAMVYLASINYRTKNLPR